MGSDIDEFIQRVNERTDIYSVVSSYVPLTQKSGRFWGCCPFHNEKTASFCVSPDKGFFYCFGCGVGGNVFKFISLIENVTYFEAIKLQAQKLGIDLPERNASPEEERRRREEKTLLKINESAQDFYHECLTKGARGSDGRKYLEGRGISAKTIETFKLGFAPEEWEVLLPKLTRQGIFPKQAEAAGLIAQRKNSSGYYDRFRGRIMIPITDVFGHVVGFGGRILNSTDDKNPKYLNTPETMVFNKGKLLFGLDKSNRAISRTGATVVVEGYMDAISLFSAGIENVVATLGTAFTADHAKLILRYAHNIIFCYDSDEAGQRATLRALPIVQATGAEVFVVKVPDGKDPDEFIRKHGKAAFEDLLKNAVTLVDYRLNYVLANANLSTIGEKLKALQEILPVVAKLTDKAAQNEYRRKIALALSMDERSVGSEWRKFLKAGNPQLPKNSSPVVKNLSSSENPDVRLKEASDNILRMLWHEDELLEYVTTVLSMELFMPLHREIIEWLKGCKAKGQRADKLTAAQELSEEANVELTRILLSGSDEPRNTELKLFNDSIDVLRQAVLKKKYHELMAQANEYKSSDKAAYTKAIHESLKVKKELDNL